MQPRLRRPRSISRWAIGVFSCGAFGAAIIFVATNQIAVDVNSANAVTLSAAEARALGARWRAEPTVALGQEYAEALITAGLYDDLLTETARNGLLATDALTSAAFRAEASMRQGRYAEALAIANSGQDPFFAFVRAQAAYALTADVDKASNDLARALRGPKELTVDAWLFRARLALDVNDFLTAGAAARRAVEAGADLRQAEEISIEIAIRGGDLDFAAKEIDRRSNTARFAAGHRPRGDNRLTAMSKIKSGDPRGAVRLLDEIQLLPRDPSRAALLVALAKWMNGEGAQAFALVSTHLGAAPQDWIALDLATAIARDLGRADDADALLKRLAAKRPALAFFRDPGDSPDEAFTNLLALKEEFSAGGAAAALLGGDSGLPPAISEPAMSDRVAVSLAAALRRNDPSAMRSLANKVSRSAANPISLALAGATFIRLGRTDRADRVLRKSAAAATDFFAPVLLRARLLVDGGERAAAIGLVRTFMEQNPRCDAARLELAVLYAEGGKLAAARKTFAALPATLVFQHEKTARLYARSIGEAGPHAKEDLLAAAREAGPSDLVLGSALAEVGDDIGAAAAFRRALINDPENDQIPLLYVTSMDRQGRAEEARSLLAEIVGRRPEAAAARNALALAGVEGRGIAGY